MSSIQVINSTFKQLLQYLNISFGSIAYCSYLVQCFEGVGVIQWPYCLVMFSAHMTKLLLRMITIMTLMEPLIGTFMVFTLHPHPTYGTITHIHHAMRGRTWETVLRVARSLKSNDQIQINARIYL